MLWQGRFVHFNQTGLSMKHLQPISRHQCSDHLPQREDGAGADVELCDISLVSTTRDERDDYCARTTPDEMFHQELLRVAKKHLSGDDYNEIATLVELAQGCRNDN